MLVIFSLPTLSSRRYGPCAFLRYYLSLLMNLQLPCCPSRKSMYDSGAMATFVQRTFALLTVAILILGQCTASLHLAVVDNRGLDNRAFDSRGNDPAYVPFASVTGLPHDQDSGQADHHHHRAGCEACRLISFTGASLLPATAVIPALRVVTVPTPRTFTVESIARPQWQHRPLTRGPPRTV